MGITTNPPQCEHGNTATYAEVERVTNDGRVVGFQLIARVTCRDCGQPFHFPNLLDVGGDGIARRPSVSDYATELIVPMGPGPLDPFKN